MKTIFQYYMEQKDKCERKGKKAKDGNLRIFYAKAAKGFEQKALGLSTEDASKPYEK